MSYRESLWTVSMMLAVSALAVDAVSEDKIVLKDVPYVVQQARLD